MPKGIYDRTTSYPRPKGRVDTTFICGVYAILNTETGETYIGSSKDIRGRIFNHQCYMRKGTHECRKLRIAVEQYGIDKFTFVILEECQVFELFLKEQEWFEFLKPEYNSIDKASPNNKATSLPLEVRELISKSLVGNTRTLGYRHREDSKIKMSVSRENRKDSFETRLKKSESGKRAWVFRKQNKSNG